jgi:uncharacterized protein (DUF1330 family)
LRYGEAAIITSRKDAGLRPPHHRLGEKHGGKYLARGARPQVLEGGPAHNMLIIEFENADAARRCYASPEYQATKAVRQGNSKLRLLLVEDFVKEAG